MALFGVSVVGVCNEDENPTVHGAAATVFFAGYDLFMLLAVLGDRLRGGAAAPRWQVLRDALGCVGGALAPCVVAYRFGLLGDPALPSLPAVLDCVEINH